MESTGYVFPLHEEDGSSYFQFEATQPNMSIGILGGYNPSLPTSYILATGNCGNLTITDSGQYADGMSELAVYLFKNLQVGIVYTFGLINSTEYFELEVSLNDVLVPLIASGNTCLSGNCNLVPNPGLETEDPGTALPIGGKHFTGHPFAFIDEACGWERTSTDALNTFDYYLSINGGHNSFVNFLGGNPWPSSYADTCGTNTNAQGNVCAGLGRNSTNGVLRFISAQVDISSGTCISNRREYASVALEHPLQNNNIYYVSTWMRHETDRDFRSEAYQLLFAEDNLTNNNHPTAQGGVLTQYGTPQIDLANTIDLNINGWQNHAEIFMYSGNSDASLMMIGNFLDDNASTPHMQGGFNTGAPEVLDDRPAAYFDDFEVIELGNAGPDLGYLCDRSPVSLGTPAPCINDSLITYTWVNITTSQALGSAMPLVVTPNVGQNTYQLTMVFRGQTYIDWVTVTTAPDLIVTDIYNLDCGKQADATYQLNHYLTNLSIVNSTNLGYTNYYLNPNGELTIYDADVLNNANFGTITFTGTFNQATGAGGNSCTKTFTVNFFECCRTFKDDYLLLPDGAQTADYFANNSAINNTTFAVYGTLTINGNYNFNNCKFYMMPDAQIIIDQNVNVNFKTSLFEACGDYKWDRIYHNQSSSTVDFTSCTISDALRGIHSTDDAVLSLTKNVFSRNIICQLIQQYAVQSALSWSSNSYNLFDENHKTSQSPNSNVTLPLSSANATFKTVGIKLNYVQDVDLSGGNHFWTDDNNAEDNIHLWCLNGSNGQATNNYFHEGFNIFSEDVNFTFLKNRFEKNAGNSILGTSGIKTIYSNVNIVDNDLFDGAHIWCQNPTQTLVHNNYIEYNSSSPAITVFSNTIAESYTKIDANEIHNHSGISVENIKTPWPNNSGKKVIVHNNDIFITQELTNYIASGPIRGISAINCNGVSIGENTVVCDYGSAVPLPGDEVNNIPVNTDKTVGIWVDNCQDAMVGCNETHYFGQGIHLQGDVSGVLNPIAPNQFANNIMASCYNGLFLENNVNVSPFGNPNGYAVDNTWPASTLPGSSITNARVLDNRYPSSSPAPATIYYYYSSTTSNPLILNQFFQGLFGGSTNNCGISSPPSQKTKGINNISDFSKIIVYPNPANETLSISSIQPEDIIIFLRLTNLIGHNLDLKNRKLSKRTINVSDLPSGVYFMHIKVNNKVERIKFVKQ